MKELFTQQRCRVISRFKPTQPYLYGIHHDSLGWLFKKIRSPQCHTEVQWAFYPKQTLQTKWVLHSIVHSWTIRDNFHKICLLVLMSLYFPDIKITTPCKTHRVVCKHCKQSFKDWVLPIMHCTLWSLKNNRCLSSVKTKTTTKAHEA